MHTLNDIRYQTCVSLHLKLSFKVIEFEFKIINENCIEICEKIEFIIRTLVP